MVVVATAILVVCVCVHGTSYIIIVKNVCNSQISESTYKGFINATYREALFLWLALQY